MALIYDVAKRYKNELARANDKAIRDIVRVHVKSWKRLNGDLTRLLAQIQTAQDMGEPVSLAWIARFERYQTLMNQIQAEVNKLAGHAVDITTGQMELALDLGVKHSEGLMATGLGKVPKEVKQAGYTMTFNKVPMSALTSMVGFLQDGTPLEYKFKGMAPLVALGIKDTLSQGIELGWSPRKTAATIKQQYDGALTNTLLTCRTETLRAYRTASHENYKANSDVVDGWIWQCAELDTTCEACWAKNGTVHPITEQLTDHPGGMCCALPKTKTWAEMFPNLDISKAEETRAEPWNPEERFAKLSQAERLRILGPTKAHLYENGKISITDLAVKVENSQFGDHFRPKTLRELMDSGKVTRKAVADAQAQAKQAAASLVKVVGDALNLPKSGTYSDAVKHAVSVIDKVHSDGRLPKINLNIGSVNSAFGVYQPGPNKYIKLSNMSNHPHPNMTTVHEIGHFLDDQGIGTKGIFASVSSPMLDKWRKAVYSTDAIKSLIDLRANALFPKDRNYYNRLLVEWELFARSYAQYITLKSGDKVLASELKYILSNIDYEHRQWPEKDFKPIMKAFDDLFRKLKWIK